MTAFLIILLICAVSCAGLYVVNKYLIRSKAESLNEVAAAMFGFTCLIYSLVLAFVVIAVWEDYEELRSDLNKEVQKLYSLVSVAEEYPADDAKNIRGAVFIYVQSVVNEKWPMQVSGKHSVNTHQKFLDIRKALLAAADSLSDADVNHIAFDDYIQLRELRHERIESTHSHLPAVVWLVLVAGGVICILFSYFLKMPQARLQYVMTFFMSLMIAMVVWLTFTLNHPWTGYAKLSKQPFEQFLLEQKQVPE